MLTFWRLEKLVAVARCFRNGMICGYYLSMKRIKYKILFIDFLGHINEIWIWYHWWFIFFVIFIMLEVSIINFVYMFFMVSCTILQKLCITYANHMHNYNQTQTHSHAYTRTQKLVCMYSKYIIKFIILCKKNLTSTVFLYSMLSYCSLKDDNKITKIMMK